MGNIALLRGNYTCGVHGGNLLYQHYEYMKCGRLRSVNRIPMAINCFMFHWACLRIDPWLVIVRKITYCLVLTTVFGG